MIPSLSRVDGRGQANKAAESMVIIPPRTTIRMSVVCGESVMAAVDQLEAENL